MNHSQQNEPVNNNEQQYLIRKLAYLLRLEQGINPFPVNEEEVTWFEEYFEAHPEFCEHAAQGLKQLESESIMRWFELAVYLRDQLRQGNTEFRMSATGERKLTIRPFGKEKKYLDIIV